MKTIAIDNPSARWHYPLRWLILIILGLAVYAQTFGFGFVFDDLVFIVNDPYITRFDHVHYIWTTFPRTRTIGFYSFALNFFFNQLNPVGYHVFNFVIHLLAAGLVWALAGLLFKITPQLSKKDQWTKELPFMIAVLFLVHPCQTQAVTYISQRFESMGMVFYLGTMCCYLQARLSEDKVRKIILFGLAGLLTILGIMAKETVATIPVMMLASEWILFPKKDNRGFYIVLVASGVLLYLLFSKMVRADLSIFLQPILSDSHPGDILTPAHYFLTQMRVFLTFVRLLILPIHQNADYDYPASIGLLQPPLTLAGIAVIAAMIFLIIKLRRKAPLIAFGLAWMLITFSINLAPRVNVIFEHKLYLISFGFLLAGVSFLSMLVSDRKKLIAILCCAAVVWSVVSFERNQVWRDNLTLWSDTVQKSPHKARPHYNLGKAYDKTGNFIQALAEYTKAIEINPDYTDAYINRGGVFIFGKLGSISQALSDFNKAIKIAPKDERAYNDRGSLYSLQGSFTKSLADFDKVIEIDPRFAGGYYNRALVWDKQGRFAQAISDYTKAIEIDPTIAQAQYNRGRIYEQQGDITKTLPDYNRAIEIDPQYVKAYNSRGDIYNLQGNIAQALSDYNKVIAINPGYAEVYSKRGLIYAKQGDLAQSLSDEDRAIEINPGYAEAYNNRGITYGLQGNVTKSLFDFNKAIEINPGYVDAYSNRGLIYDKQGNFAKALSDENKAVEINPGYAAAYYNRAIIYYHSKKYDKALADLNKAEQLGAPANPGFRTSIKAASDRVKLH